MTNWRYNLPLAALLLLAACAQGVETGGPSATDARVDSVDGAIAVEPDDILSLLDTALIKPALAAFGRGGCPEPIMVVTLTDEYGDQMIPIYENKDTSRWHAFSFVYDDSDGEYDYYKEGFAPYTLDVDNYGLAMISPAEDAGYYTVAVDERGTEKRIKKAPYLKRVPLVERLAESPYVSLIAATPVLTKSGKTLTLPKGIMMEVLGAEFGRLVVAPTDTVIPGQPFLLGVCHQGEINVYGLK